MQKFASALLNKKIFCFHSGRSIANVSGYIVDKSKLEIVLLEVVTLDKNEKRYVLTSDIRTIANNLVIINSEEDIVEADELVRYSDTIKENYKITGSKVVNQERKKLGSVSDFTIDYENFKLSKLYVKTNILRRLIRTDLIVDREQIIDIKDKTIIVKSTAVKTKETQNKLLQVKA